MSHEIGRGVAICTPMPVERKADGQLRLANITVEWHRARHSLGTPTNVITGEIVADGMEVGEARNKAVEAALSSFAKKPEFLFFIDYDVIVPPDALIKLLYRARRHPEYDIICGIYCCKSDFLPEPLIYMRDGDGCHWDWAIGDLIFDLASCHMGCTLIRTTLFERMKRGDDNPLFLTQNRREINEKGVLEIERGTEDIYFCNRARKEAGARIMADSSVLCGHQDRATGIIYGINPKTWPAERSKWMQRVHGVGPAAESERPIAIDIGAGGLVRPHIAAEYDVETTDIRPDTKPTYVMDSLALNLPKNHYDMVCSSHHLEHIGRWDQEKIWAEMFRILKPGGVMEHVVPNVAWAAGHLVEGHIDEHVMNVLYGAQEAHGYERDYNTHYFAYTPETARALAENCGLVDVTIQTHKDDPDLHYNLIIRGRKPEKAVEPDEEPEVEAGEVKSIKIRDVVETRGLPAEKTA